MCRKLFFVFIIAGCLYQPLAAQEIQARITINTSHLGTPADKKAFQTLQSTLTNFLNNRKWTNTTFWPNEKIVCSFLLNVSEALGNGNYRAALTVQAARPVFNTSYETPLINFLDEAFTFDYAEFPHVDFNDSRVSGSDPLGS